MSFWNFVSDLAPILEVGATAYGASQKAKSYDKATAAGIKAQEEATARDLAAREEANKLLKQQQQVASPGLTQLQSVIGRQDQLTPAQMQALEDARRTGIDNLNAGSLRGSARATSAVVSDIEGRTRNNMLAQNQQRADNAAGQLAGQYFSAGNSVANNTVGAGQVASQGLTAVGNLNATNAINQGAINGTAIGDIGAVIADTIKSSQNQKRDSSYGDIHENPTKKEDITWYKV